MKIEFKWIVLIVLLFGGLLYLQSWAAISWRELQGPDLLAKDQQGNLYVEIHSKILRYTPDGKYIDQRDLRQLGINSHIGGISFFSNGDMLMVPQSYNPSLWQRFFLFYRVTDRVSNVIMDASGRLSRCTWESLSCTPLPEFTSTFSRVFWVDVDENENIFLADTTQHKIFWLDKNGHELDTIANRNSLQFPNQIKREGNYLWVANCNDNSLSRIQLGDDKFNQTMQRFPFDGRGLTGDRWPTGVARMDGETFVLAQGDNLMHGSIYRMDAAGAVNDVFVKDKSADLIALVAFNKEILVADFASLSIKRYSKFGALNGEFGSPEFTDIATQLKKEIVNFKRLNSFFSLLFWLSLAVGFAIALWLENRHKKRQSIFVEDFSTERANTHFSPDINDKRIQWLVHSVFFVI